MRYEGAAVGNAALDGVSPSVGFPESFAGHSECRDSAMSPLSFVKRSVVAFLLRLIAFGGY
jgi:hypothetical protein